MRRIGLKRIYLASLTAVVVAAFAMFVVFDYTSQMRQSEAAMLEEARTFAREMDAVWEFMDNQQKVINTSSDGDYDFKGLHCAIVGKSVGAIFSYKNDYAIRYTNFDPRSVQNRPDAFETEALTALYANPAVAEYYGIAEYQGEERFRYLQALEVDRSCLECHGEPVGEIDITGHAKEGWTLDSVGGAISIVIPLDQQREAAYANLWRDSVLAFVLTALAGLVVYWITRHFVLRPLERMNDAFGKMGKRRFEVSLDESGASREMADLIASFNDMADELRGMYEHLEDQVVDRTRDLKAANAELERQKDSLEKLSAELAKESELKSDLLSMVNHEMRTPLTTVIALAHMAIEDCDKRLETHSTSEERENREAWTAVLSSSRNLLGMINNMLDVARSSAGMTTVACELMDLGDIALAVRNTVKPIAKRSGVDFRTNVAADVPLVLGDFEKTTRLLENLAGNAVKFTPKGGAVRLDIALDGDAGDVVMRVSDTGIGIAPEDQERIFDKFVQVDISSRRRYGGSGLGLALVRDYVEAQGFSLSLESKLREGSTFAVRIPNSLVVDDDCERVVP